MAINTVKFSQFASAGTLADGNIIVGLGASPYGNAQFIADVSGNTLQWNTVTSATVQMESYNGYVTNSANTITFSLPTTSSVGDIIAVAGLNTGGWVVDIAAGQSIILSPVTATSVVASTNQYNYLFLLCLVADTVWTSTNIGSDGLFYA